MISVMSTEMESPSDLRDDVVREGPTVSSNIDGGNDSSGGLRLYSVGAPEESEKVSRANDDKFLETRVSNASNEASSVSVLKYEEASFRAERVDTPENQPSSSLPKMQMHGKGSDSQSSNSENTKARSVVNDYDSMLSAFDEFASKNKGDSVGYEYQIGDMVWGKVKSHPWWPGHIYNEEHASPSVRKTKREGHLLVAFFGDSSYGWFLPAELIPFEPYFAEKSRQTNLRSFLNAVEEAVDELSRRRSLGLACRCRNEFNFWPSRFENYFVVDVGDCERGIYSLSQINKARDSFQPRELLSFIQQMALTSRSHQHWTIEFIKNKATVLECRKSLFEEFDETYAQAFGSAPVRPQRPTAPVAVDPAKAPLSGRLVIAEALDKGEISRKPTKTKDQVEKDKYLFKRRDEPSPKKPKKASSVVAGIFGQPLLVDGLGLSGRVLYPGIGDTTLLDHESNATYGQNHPLSNLASMVSDIKPIESSRKLGDAVTKKAKLLKRPAEKLSAEHAALVENKKKKSKKETRTDASSNSMPLPVALRNSGVPLEKVSGMLPHRTPLSDNYQLDSQKNGGVGSPSHVELLQAADFGNLELPILLRDLRYLALNPFHRSDSGCAGTVRPVFLSFRSLVYQKSLVLAPTESEASEARSSKLLPVDTNLAGLPDETSGVLTKKPVKPSVRPDDSTKVGIKRAPLDSMKGIKKKKMVDSEGMEKNFSKKKFSDPEGIKKRKPMDDFEDMMKKKISEPEDIKKLRKIGDSKSLAAVKKPFQRSVESQRADVKEITAKNTSPTLPKAAKLESIKKMEKPVRTPNPTMLVMKFPSGAGLPSGAELRARFARFGPMDPSATRVFWKSYTCRLVFHYKADAQAALKFINGNSNLFGNTNVRCYLRDLLAEAAESESAKIQKEDLSSVNTSQSQDSADQRIAASQLLQQSVQLKSCLKKPSIEEGGNGGGRGTRVKFVLDGEENGPNEQIISGNKNSTNSFASFPEGPSSSTTYSLDNSKNLVKFIPHSNITLPSSTGDKFPINTMPSIEQAPARLHPLSNTQQIMPSEHMNNDISQEMLNLLNKCSDVVKNLTGVLGYLPYRPL